MPRVFALYNVNKEKQNEIVLTRILGKDEEEESEETDNFPYFLFDEKVAKTVKEIVFSKEEMEIFGYWNYTINYNINHPCEFAFFEKYGGFYTTRYKLNNIYEKIYFIDNLPYYGINTTRRNTIKIINDYGENNPNKEYRFCSMSKKHIIAYLGLEKIIEKCKEIYEQHIFMDNEKNVNSYAELELLKNIEEATKKHESVVNKSKQKVYYPYNVWDEIPRRFADFFEIIKICKNDNTEEYARYLQLLNKYNETPELYEYEPKCPKLYYTYEIKLSQKGEKFLKWCKEENEK